MRILYITEKWYPEGGGGEIYFHNLTKNLKRLGHEIYVISAKPINIKINNHIKLLSGISVKHNYRDYSITSMLGRIKYIFQILFKLRLIKLKRIDIIHTITPVTSFIGSIIGYLLDIPVIISVLSLGGFKWQEITQNKFKGLIYRIVEHFSIKFSTKIMRKIKIITISREFLIYLMKINISKNKIEYIPNAIDSTFFEKDHEPTFRNIYKISNDKVVLGYLGALEQVKDIPSLLLAFKKLNSNNKYFLLIAGSGSQKETLIKLVNELNLKNCIFLGKIDHRLVPNFLESINILILPSISEGFPTVCLEALAMNKPIISSKFREILPFIAHGKNGFFINSNNKVNEIYQYCKLFENKWPFNDIYINNIANLIKDKFSWNNISKKIEEIYIKTLKNFIKK
ncbi:MAG: glycosyltransferase family 4 protein [Candidatus Helarchaeota archaeon]